MAKGTSVSIRLNVDDHERFKAASRKYDMPVSLLMRAGAQRFIRELDQADDVLVLVSKVQQEEKGERHGKPDTN